MIKVWYPTREVILHDKKRNKTELSAEQRNELEKFSNTGVHSARLIKRAQIILLLDTSKNGKAVKFEEIAQRLNVSMTTITKVKAAFIGADGSATAQNENRLGAPSQMAARQSISSRRKSRACDGQFEYPHHIIAL